MYNFHLFQASKRMASFEMTPSSSASNAVVTFVLSNAELARLGDFSAKQLTAFIGRKGVTITKFVIGSHLLVMTMTAAYRSANGAQSRKDAVAHATELGTKLVSDLAAKA